MLTNTIVAGNTLTSSTPDDIDLGPSINAVTGSFNLIGIGGSGGLVQGSQGNIVLTTLDGLGLVPLADHGGPTQTMALLAGSPAIHEGTAISGITTDQRGLPLDTPTPDIGAFQVQPSEQAPLAFPAIKPPSLAVGDSSITIVGKLTSGVGTPAGESVAITFAGMTQLAKIQPDGSFSTTFETSSLAPSSSGYSLQYTYTSDGTFPSVTATAPLLVSKGNSTVGLTELTGTAVYGQAITLTASVTPGPASAGGTVTFFDGGTPIGNAVTNSSGVATLVTTSLGVGAHSITANYGGNDNLLSANSGAISESISRSPVVLTFIPQGFRNNRNKVIKIGLDARVSWTASAPLVPTGTVRFMIKNKTIGIETLDAGHVGLTVQASKVLKQSLTIVYSGDSNYLGETLTTPKVTQGSLATRLLPTVAYFLRGR